MSIRAALSLLVLVAADAGAQTWVELSGGEWEADEPVLEDALFELRGAFAKAANYRLDTVPPWASYELKYRESIEGGVRLLHVTGTCDEYEPPEPIDGEEVILMADGGPCHFDATYDPSKGEVVYFFLHGYA